MDETKQPDAFAGTNTGRTVASFRLPISVKSLAMIVDGLTREYGKELTMRQVDVWLVIEQPNPSVLLPHAPCGKEQRVVGGQNG